MTTLSLTNLFKPISFYNMDFDMSDFINDEINDKYLPKDFDDDKLDYYQIMKNTKRDYLDMFIEKVDIEAIKKALKKYGLKYNGFVFFSPKFYNYDTDSIDIKYEVVDDDLKHFKQLDDFITLYLTEERQGSSDGYMSIEPQYNKDVEKDDYAYLWAILKSENLIDDIVFAITDCEEAIRDIYRDNFLNELGKFTS